jgi:uncharacterized membrane protein
MVSRRLALIGVVALAIFLAFSLSRMAAEPRYDDSWWNASWHYRMKIEVNASNFSRFDWPVESDMNFTAILSSLNVSGTFDRNSTRVVEYNSSGSIRHELPSQFDIAEDYNSSNNAHGEVVFILNGTTPLNTVRYFYIYFDILENGNKALPAYPSMLNYTWDGEEAAINNSRFIVYIDTSRGENTSGIYRVYSIPDDSEWFFSAGATEATIEYTQLTNGSQNFSFDLRNNASFTSGPVRIRLRQSGQEMIWGQPSSKTNQTAVVKEYFFYPNSTFLRVRHNITNTGTSALNRSSNVGISGFNVSKAYESTYKVAGNESNPGSWIRGTYTGGGPLTGFIHLNQSHDVFYATNITSPQRIGIKMNSTTLESNASIYNAYAMVFGDTVKTPAIMEDTKDILLNEVNLTQHPPERHVIDTYALADHTVYNRNETILITGNITFDPWNLTRYMNATLDMGTPSGADDQTIALSFNSSYGNQTSGYRLYTGYFNLTNSSEVGYWNITLKIYDASRYYLNESYFIFNVTSGYFVNLTILNPLGLPSRTIYANLDIKNLRQDIWVPGASINCSYGATQVTNITDNANGTYSINLTAPSVFGLYTLNCSAIKNGNFGHESENFTVESPTTNMSISRTPIQYNASSVFLNANESFSLNVTLENTGNSSAYSTNITLSLPSGWGSNPQNSACSDIPISGSCTRTFNISIPANTTPGGYRVNITANWTNLDSSKNSNSTYLDINVTQNPSVYVPQESLTVIMAPGNTSTAGTLTVSSAGNYPLSGINFTVTGLSGFAINFTPTGISSLYNGQNQSVQVNVTAYPGQATGIYSGLINISSSNNGFDIVNLTVIVTGTSLSIAREPQNFTANITYYQNDSFALHVEINNTGNVTAFYSNITLGMPQNWTSNLSYYYCGNLSLGQNCTRDFLITVFRGTPSGSYLVNVTIGWQDIGIGPMSNATYVNVTVLSNRTLAVPQSQFYKNISHGTEVLIDYITLNSTGNDPLTNISFAVSGFFSITLGFSPSNLSSLAAGGVQNITLNGTVPAGHDPGTFNGTINITTGNDGYKIVNVSITVPQNGSWAISPVFCERVQSPVSGDVCNITINNTGNLVLNFTIFPDTSHSNMSNYTYTSVPNFTVNKQESFILTASYDVTGVAGQGWKNSTYRIDPQQSYASPDYSSVLIALNPSIVPVVNMSVTPARDEQLRHFLIYANASSQSGNGIAFVTARVTRPDGTLDSVNMSQLYWTACVLAGTTCWYANYTSGWGQTVVKGNYSINVTAYDNSGTQASSITSFQVFTKMMINLTTGASTYMQGDTGTVYYRARDFNYTSLPGANASITITNPNGTAHGIIFSSNNYTARPDGWAVPFPTFTLTNDAVLGNYTISSYSSFYDANASLQVNSTNQYTMLVTEKFTQGGLFADLETTVVWYPNGIMKFGFLVYDSNGQPLDPDQLNLTVYDPADNVYLSVGLSSSNLTKRATGYYTYQHAMGSVATGMYMAVLNVSKGTLKTHKLRAFRVAQGGPYDVRLRVLEPEVPRGDYVDFEIVVENMGEAGQDVDLTYWVSDGAQTWSMASEAVYTPARINLTVLRSLYIFSNQNLGMHTLNLLVNYSYINPEIRKNATFLVTNQTVQPPQPPGPGPGPGAPPAGGEGGGGGEGPPEIKIIEYPEEMGVEVGVSRITNIKITNIGGSDAKNITMSLSGIDAGWFEIGFPTIDTIKPNETKIIPLKILVPAGSRSGEFIVKIKADSKDTRDQKIFKLIVFTSRKDLIEFELARLKAKTDELEMKANQIKEDYDVEDVLKLIGQIRSKISEAEGYLRESKYDASLGSIYAGWDLYNKAAEMLQKAQRKRAPELIPMWLLILILVLLGLIIFLVVVLRKLSLNLKVLLRGRYTEAKTVAGIVRKEPEVDSLREEKDKIQRMLSLLQTQYKQGIISKEAYDGLRASSEQKMRNIDERIRKELKV